MKRLFSKFKDLLLSFLIAILSWLVKELKEDQALRSKFGSKVNYKISICNTPSKKLILVMVKTKLDDTENVQVENEIIDEMED